MTGRRIMISGGRVIDPANGIDGVMPVYVAKGKIAGVGVKPEGFQPDQEISAAGHIVCPGFVDLCARLREPGSEQEATIASETLAAAAGGITTLCCPPDTFPVIDTPAVIQLLMDRAESVGKSRILPIGALTRGLAGTELSEMSALKDAGAIAVSNASLALANPLVHRRALEYAASYDLLVMIRPEDPWLRNGGCAHEGEMATKLGLPGIPTSAETVAVAQSLALIEAVGGRAHFCQLSSERAVEMIAEARSRGVPVTADVAAHHTDLTEGALDGFNANAHVNPPLRTEVDRAGLRRGVANGALQAICSDHQPHDLDAKLDAFPATEPGVSALEALLPLTLRLVSQGVVDLSTAIERLTAGPARVLDIASGTLSLGVPADICIFDPDLDWQVDTPLWLSRGHNTPYWGDVMRGRVTHTLLGGRVIFRL
ncbi:MAG: dihydroorotase [Proteobacteria bacterium]|nr:dihydroorotase [Pseudomonadota bacterium]